MTSKELAYYLRKIIKLINKDDFVFNSFETFTIPVKGKKGKFDPINNKRSYKRFSINCSEYKITGVK